MAAAIGSHGIARFGGESLPRPATVVMAYAGHSDVSSAEPATFVVVGEHDGVTLPAVMEMRVNALRRAGTEVEYHKYPNLGHGFGRGTGTSAEGWLADAIRFWERQMEDKARREQQLVSSGLLGSIRSSCCDGANENHRSIP